MPKNPQAGSLRDYFAAQVLQGWLANGASQRVTESIQASPATDNGVIATFDRMCQQLSQASYQMADAMLAERAK